MPASYNYYEILGLSKEAGAAEIKAAYRQLAMKYHPDKNPSPDAHKQFVAINAAYSVLSDPFKRKLYDVSRQAGRVIYRKSSSAKAHAADPVDPEEMRRRYWASPAGQQKSRQMKKDANFFRKSHFIGKILSIPLLIFMLLFLVERYFPKEIPNQTLTEIGYRYNGGIRTDYLYQFGENAVWAKTKYKNCFRGGEKVTLYRGRIFGLVSAIKLQSPCSYLESGLSGEKKKVSKQIVIPSESLFGGPIFLVFLVIVLLAFIWLNNDPEYGVATFIVALGISFFIFLLFNRLFPVT